LGLQNIGFRANRSVPRSFQRCFGLFLLPFRKITNLVVFTESWKKGNSALVHGGCSIYFWYEVD